MNLLFCQKGCYNLLKANLTEPSKINQFVVLHLQDFKLNKAEAFGFFGFTLSQIVMMSFSKECLFLILTVVVFVAACRNKDRLLKEAKYDQLYFDYSVTAEEGDETVACVFQYRSGGEEGKATNIEPAKVLLDGNRVETDSAKLSGFFYEVQRPIDSFAGKHSIVFITPDDNEIRNEFEFFPFTVGKGLPERIKKKPFTIELKGFPKGERSVRLLLLDTAFESAGFNEMVPVIDGKVNIDAHILSSVKTGPVVLQLVSEEELALRRKNAVIGKISITYGLKREIQLVK